MKKYEMNNKLVFLSRPNPFKKIQCNFLEHLKLTLSENGISTITLAAGNYDLSESMVCLKGMIKQCYGVIIVSFKQIFIDNGTKKRGAEENVNFFQSKEESIVGSALTSPFCQIEGTIGILNDLPMLVINEEGVREEGVIQGGKYCVKTIPFRLDNISDFFSDPLFKEQFSVWLGRVSDYYLFLNQKKC